MRDPHIQAIFYEARESDTDRFLDGDAAVDERDSFRVSIIKQGERILATFQMREHFATEEDAKAVTDAYLRALEVKSALTEYGGRHILHFDYIGTEIVDRSNPPTDGMIALSGRLNVITSGSAVLTVTRSLPSLPIDFKWTPDVETLWNRYQQYAKGHEPLLSMAYFCMQVAEMYAGGAPSVAKRYGISKNVWAELGRISSNRGDGLEARKPDRDDSLSRLMEEEKAWVDAVVRRLILRVGECAYDTERTLSVLTMADLPTLPNPDKTRRDERKLEVVR